MNPARAVLVAVAFTGTATCRGRESNAASRTQATTWADSIRVVHDTIKGLPGLMAYAPSFPESVVVQGWLGTSTPAFLVISGFEPEGGDYTGPELFVLRPGERIMWGVKGTPSPWYPGDIISWYDSLVVQSRAFVGQCSDSGRAFIQFIRYRAGRKAPWRDSTHVFTARNDSLVGVANQPGLRLEEVLKRVADSRCHEIPPIAHHTPSDEEPPSDTG